MEGRIITTAILSVVLLGSFSAAYQPASAVITIIFDDFNVEGGSATTTIIGVPVSFANTNVNPSYPVPLDRTTSVELFAGSQVFVEINSVVPGALVVVPIGASTYRVLLEYASTSDIDITAVEDFELLFATNNDATLRVGIEALDNSGFSFSCTDKLAPALLSPFTVSFHHLDDCTAEPSFDPARVATLEFFFFNSNEGFFLVDAIQQNIGISCGAGTTLNESTHECEADVTQAQLDAVNAALTAALAEIQSLFDIILSGEATICHNNETKIVGLGGLTSHLLHGDTQGSC